MAMVILELPGFTNAFCNSMVTLTDVSVGDVVISEIMHSSDAVYDYKGEWFRYIMLVQKA